MSLQPSLASLTGDLDFQLGDSVNPASSSLVVQARSNVHQKQRTMFSQIAFVAQSLASTTALCNEKLSSDKQRVFRMAVVLPDIMPLEGEFVGKELLLHLFRLNIIAPGNVLLISNRNDIRSLLGPEFRICATLKRMDESLVTYSLIVFTSNTLYLGLSIEPIRNISFSPATVFMATNTSLSVEKIMQMFHPNSAIPFNYRADTAEGKDQATFWIPQDLENEWVLPDIGKLSLSLLYYRDRPLEKHH